jgi:hypothetical protein
MRPLLPNFPAEVLSQWFFDHWSQIDDYAWLGFDRLRFDRREWTSEQIMQSGIQENDSIQIDHRHFEKGILAPRIERIACFFDANGTWPVPPIFLDNTDNDITRPDGWRLTTPYHLLEGSHRAAIFWTYHSRGALVSSHFLWVSTLEDA